MENARSLSTRDALAWLVARGLEACDRDDRTSLELALAHALPSDRATNATCVAIEATLLAEQGRIEQALALFRDALTREIDREQAARIWERFIALLFQIRALDEARDAIVEALDRTPGDVALEALDLSIRAESRRASVAELSILERRATTLDDGLRSRIYLRLSSAAYQLKKSDLAEKYALLCASMAVRASMHRLVAIAYQNLVYLYANEIGDASIGRRYLDLSLHAAEKAGDAQLRASIWCVAYGFAAETGDAELLERLRANPLHERSLDVDTRAFLPILGDAFYYGMRSAWAQMRGYLGGIDPERLRSPQLALYYALRGVAAAGDSDEEKALHDVGIALNLGRPFASESNADGRMRIMARALSIAVLVRANKKSRATQAFTSFRRRMNAATRTFTANILSGTLDLDHDAPTLRGYTRMIQNLAAQPRQDTNRANLTKRELDVLYGFVEGGTARTIAQDLHLTTETVAWHATNIRAKLKAHRMIGAIEKARGLGIIP